MRLRILLLAPLLLLASLTGIRYFFPQPPLLELLREAQSGGDGPIIVVSPHPDDETLAASGIIRETIERGGDIHIVLITNGDAFRLAAERRFGKIGLTDADMLAFGQIRQQELVAAMAVLGLSADHITFLNFPDRGTPQLWLEHWSAPYRSPFTGLNESPAGVPYSGQALLGELTHLFDWLRPGLVIYPHSKDSHIDHWGVHNFTVAALEDLRRRILDWEPPDQRLYLMHRGDWPAPKGLLPPGPMADDVTTWVHVPLTEEQARGWSVCGNGRIVAQHDRPIALRICHGTDLPESQIGV